MKVPSLSLFLAIAISLSAHAGVVCRSPDTAHISSFASVKWLQLRRLSPNSALVASVTFSNEPYVSDIEPARQERVDFVLPGLEWDARTGTYTVKSAAGARTPVATR